MKERCFGCVIALTMEVSDGLYLAEQFGSCEQITSAASFPFGLIPRHACSASSKWHTQCVHPRVCSNSAVVELHTVLADQV